MADSPGSPRRGRQRGRISSIGSDSGFSSGVDVQVMPSHSHGGRRRERAYSSDGYGSPLADRGRGGGEGDSGRRGRNGVVAGPILARILLAELATVEMFCAMAHCDRFVLHGEATSRRGGGHEG